MLELTLNGHTTGKFHNGHTGCGVWDTAAILPCSQLKSFKYFQLKKIFIYSWNFSIAKRTPQYSKDYLQLFTVELLGCETPLWPLRVKKYVRFFKLIFLNLLFYLIVIPFEPDSRNVSFWATKQLKTKSSKKKGRTLRR